MIKGVLQTFVVLFWVALFITADILIWGAFSPETFWQRVVCFIGVFLVSIFALLPICGFLGAFSFMCATEFLDEWELKRKRKRNGQ